MGCKQGEHSCKGWHHQSCRWEDPTRHLFEAAERRAGRAGDGAWMCSSFSVVWAFPPSKASANTKSTESFKSVCLQY